MKKGLGRHRLLAGLSALLMAPAIGWAQDTGAGGGEPAALAHAEEADLLRADGWRLLIRAPEPLDRLLREYLDIARFQREAAEPGALPISRAELRRLVVSAPDQARGLIDAEGHFGARITTRVHDEVPGQPIEVTLTVEPGELTQVSRVQFVFEGELDARLEAGETAAQALVDGLSAQWGLPVGAVFRQVDWTAAKNAALARLRADGYPTAVWSGTSSTVDATTRQARLFMVADSGPAFAFGDIRIEGLDRQPASAIVNTAPFRPGDPYSEKQLLDWQERIQKLNLFESIFVSTDLDPAHAKAAPVLVQVREQQMQAATTGIGVSSDTGPRVSAEYLHRNLFGLDWQAKAAVRLGRNDRAGSLDFTSHPWEGRRRGLVSTQATRIVEDDQAVTLSARARVGLLREGERLERTDYIEVQNASVTADGGAKVSEASAYSATVQWIYRDVDSRTLPTRGSTTLAQLTAGRSYSALEEKGFFGRAYVRSTWYWPLPANWYATARGEAGQVFAREAVSIPDTLLFRVGGDESVRGYAYRSLGVVTDGVVTGGRVMFTSSVEVARPILARLPALWGAVFIDVGDAAASADKLDPKVGYGVGVRFRSPVGPLKLDIARGQQLQDWRIHFSVGISL
jgi:translocation and assembly module TamA